MCRSRAVGPGRTGDNAARLIGVVTARVRHDRVDDLAVNGEHANSLSCSPCPHPNSRSCRSGVVQRSHPAWRRRACRRRAARGDARPGHGRRKSRGHSQPHTHRQACEHSARPGPRSRCAMADHRGRLRRRDLRSSRYGHPGHRSARPARPTWLPGQSRPSAAGRPGAHPMRPDAGEDTIRIDGHLAAYATSPTGDMDSRRRLVNGGVPGRLPHRFDAGPDRRDRRSAGLPAQSRPPQRLGEHRRAAARRHHRGHT